MGNFHSNMQQQQGRLEAHAYCHPGELQVPLQPSHPSRGMTRPGIDGHTDVQGLCALCQQLQSRQLASWGMSPQLYMEMQSCSGMHKGEYQPGSLTFRPGLEAAV